MLDHRDRVYELGFEFRVEISLKQIEQQDFNFLQSSPYSLIIQYIQRHLVECVTNLVSVSFRSFN